MTAPNIIVLACAILLLIALGAEQVCWWNRIIGNDQQHKGE